MTHGEYEQLKQQAHARAERQLKLDLEAIERVYRIGQDAVQLTIGGLSSPAGRRKRRKSKRKGRGWLLDAMRVFLGASNGKFTFPEARTTLHEQTGRPIVRGSLKSAFKTLIESGEMQVLRKAVGRTPGEYRKA